jgi:hypothetical protein
MNKVYIVIVLFFLFSCKAEKKNNTIEEKQQIEIVLNSWHKAVANYDFDTYFSYMTDNAVFIGTDASEYWKLEDFKTFCKPYFDKKKTWNFKPIKRNVYLDSLHLTAWFDEILDTKLGVCRGSGVLLNNGKEWKIAHYVLSLTIPNENIDKVILLNKEHDSILVKKILKQ